MKSGVLTRRNQSIRSILTRSDGLSDPVSEVICRSMDGSTLDPATRQSQSLPVTVTGHRLDWGARRGQSRCGQLRGVQWSG